MKGGWLYDHYETQIVALAFSKIWRSQSHIYPFCTTICSRTCTFYHLQRSSPLCALIYRLITVADYRILVVAGVRGPGQHGATAADQPASARRHPRQGDHTVPDGQGTVAYWLIGCDSYWLVTEFDVFLIDCGVLDRFSWLVMVVIDWFKEHGSYRLFGYGNYRLPPSDERARALQRRALQQVHATGRWYPRGCRGTVGGVR